MRKLLLLGGLAVILTALITVPMPLLEIEPGEATPTGARIELQGADEVHDIDGELLLTTVRLRSPTAFGLVEAWLDEDDDLVSRRSVVPEGVDADEFRRQQRRVFDESTTVAATVAQRAAGLDVSASGDGAQVTRVLEGSPAEGTLEHGDVIVGVDGEPVELAADVGVAISDAVAGDEVSLRVERDDDELTAEIELAELGQLERPGIGVQLRTVDREVDLAVDVELRDEEIGGPSAGLMLALTIHDMLVEDDIAAGRVIAGTGSLDTSGSVGPVGGVSQKVEAAVDAGATMFLVPAAESDEAMSAAAGDIEVVPVETFEDGLDALGAG